MNNREILIIEDESRARKNIKVALGNEGFDFIEAESVKEGIAQLQKHSDLKVILLDLSLPDGSGADFLESIKKSAKIYRVIILTAHEEHLAAEKAKEFSVFNYLPKASKSFTQSLRFTVGQAFIDIERDYLEEKNSSLMEIQSKINTDIVESLNPNETLEVLDGILDLICEKVVKLVGAYTCHIRLYSLSKGELFLASFACSNQSSNEIKTIFHDRNGSLSAKVAKNKSPEVHKDLQANETFIEFRNSKLNEIKISSEKDFQEKFGKYFKEPLSRENFYINVEKYFNTVQSAYIYPITTLMFDNETDAVFNVSSENLDFFSADKKKIINEFVTLATSAISKAWQKKRKVESDKDYKGIYGVLENISKELKGVNEIGEVDVKDKIFDIFLEGISEIIKPETISVFLYNKRTNLLDVKADKGTKQDVLGKIGHPLKEGVTGEVFSKREPIRIPNLQKGDRRKFQQHENYSLELEKKYIGEIPSGKIDHYLGVPMLFGEDVIGVVQLINKKSAYYNDELYNKSRWILERGFSNDCENVLGIAASHLAVSIKNAELLEEEKILRNVGRYTSAEMPLKELLQTINDEAAQDVKAEICLMFLFDESKSKVILKQSYGIPKENLKDENGEDAFYEIGEGLTGKIAKTGDSALEKAGESIGKYDQKILDYLNKDGENHEIESLMVVPIKAKDEILGVIKAINKEGDGEQYSEENLDFFKIFANYAGIPINNTQHYEMASEKLAIAEKNAALSHLVKAVVHEINNKKALIPINIQLARLKISQLNYDIEEQLYVMENSAKRAVKFANSIQAFSSSYLGERKPHDINEIVRIAIKELSADLKDNSNFDGIVTELNLSEEILTSSVHKIPLIQVVQNIILNAYQHMEKSRKKQLIITSYLDSKNDLIKLEFKDTGEGIKKENLEKIFDPEFTTKEGKGTGIGLWLAKTHLDNISADLKVSSILNEGTIFTIELKKNETEILEQVE